jgi:4-diphosphocytidyl-2-C-methyl-D-erythritol kinase
MNLPGGARVSAPAKVNLFLRVLGRRADGFHELETLFQAVDLCDDIEVRPTRESGVGLVLHGPDLGPWQENLAVRAARGFLELAALTGNPGVEVALRKGIPAGAGLGGGSSDAASVLRCMAALWPDAVGWPRLMDLGAALGSDVPFFMGRTTLALAGGRGEVLTPLPPLPTGHLVLVLPPVHVGTAEAYAALARLRAEHPEVAPQPGSSLSFHRTVTWSALRGLAANDFESVVPALHPEVETSLGALRRSGGDPTLLSGSGGACFGVYPGEAQARSAAEALSTRLGWPARAVRTLDHIPVPSPL